MKPRITLVLAVLAVLVVAAGWYFGLRGNRLAVENEALAGQPAFPNIGPRLQQAARIEMQHQGNTIVLDRHGDVWGVAEHSDYPAQAGKVHDLLAGVAELRLAEPRTADPAQYDRLGVEDPAAAKADSTLVSVSDEAGKPIVALIVGHSRMHGQSNLPDQVFVRRPGEAQSWLAEGRLPLENEALMWLDRDIVNIDHTKIAQVVANRAGQPQIELVRDGDKLAMKQPAQHPPLDPAKLADVERALEFMTLLRVQPAAKVPGKELGHGEFVTTDGLTLKVVANQSGNEVWARFDATGEGAAKPEADRLQKKLANWAYELGGWKEKSLIPTMDDLKAPAPAAAATPAPSPEPGAALPATPAAVSATRPGMAAPGGSAAPSGASAEPRAATPAVTPAAAGSSPPAPAPETSAKPK